MDPYNLDKPLKVSEIFLSIQGEGTEQGNPTVFIRLFGCNFSCRFCDTDYSKTGEYKQMSIEKILARIDEFMPYYYIQVTGGEPLIQESTYNLIRALIDKNKTVWINTNGSQDIKKYTQLGDRCRIMMDIKAPSSGMLDKMNYRNLIHLRAIDQIIYVIATEEDYIFARAQVRAMSFLTLAQILFSPCFEVKDKFKPEITAQDLIEKVKNDKLFVRVSLQLHKIIYNPEERGV